MEKPNIQNNESLERLTGIVERVTFQNEQNGWSMLKGVDQNKMQMTSDKDKIVLKFLKVKA